MGISLYFDGNTHYIPVGHTHLFGEANNLQLTIPLFEGVTVPTVFHNAKFDLSVLQEAGQEVSIEHVFDTMLMAHYIDENTFEHGGNKPSFELEALARLHCKNHKATAISKSAKAIWNDTPVVAMARYAETDALVTAELFKALWSDFQPYRNLWEEVDRDFMVLLGKMEDKGIPVDKAMCRDLELQCMERMDKIQEELGFDPNKQKETVEKLFSEPPVGYGLTPVSYTAKTGKPQVNKEFFEKTSHPVVGLLQEYATLKKQLTSYFRPYQELGGNDSRIHPSFKQHGTVTGRLSCANPNLQQVPRDSFVKNVFMPEGGYDLVELDYSNLELRLVARYAQSPTLMEEFSKRSGDAHGRVAQALQVERFKAKVVNFLTVYGGGKTALAKQLNVSENEAEKILKDYRRSYPEIFRAMDAAGQAAHGTNGVVRMWTGRERHFKRSSDYHKAFNSVIQGGAFEIVKRSMLKLDKAGLDIRNQVHDSVWLNTNDPQEVEEGIHIMEDWVHETFGMPFFVDSKTLRSRT
jgi:DNA polymerase-1